MFGLKIKLPFGSWSHNTTCITPHHPPCPAACIQRKKNGTKRQDRKPPSLHWQNFLMQREKKIIKKLCELFIILFIEFKKA
jgi:hypothetical protein